jgi:hypothetical protein
VPILIIVIAAVSNAVNPPQECEPCPACDCSQYQQNLSQCYNTLTNVTNQLNSIKNTTCEPQIVTETKIVYSESTTTIGITAVSFVISIGLTISLFQIRIKLPKELETKIKEIEKWILISKIISLIVSILLLIKLIFIFLF